ncbi:ATP-binding protein [Bacillus gobiensis]|uniref:ATP-binding protein n=1 Tax=Bacillus gobiensis TaxID=1441095 RepID=UPI003D1F4225
MNQQIEKLILPESIQTKIKAFHKQNITEEDQSLIGSPGYASDNEFILIDAIISLAMGKNILLKGPTGSGKTKLAETLSAVFHQPMHSINCSVDLDAEALVGYKTITNKSGQSAIEFVPGPVTKAMQKGQFLYIDEINMAKPETLPILNGVLDYRKRMTNPFTGKVVQAKEGFGVIAAINEGYVGTVPLNEALKNRFVIIDVPYVTGKILEDVLKSQSTLSNEKLIKQFVQLSSDLLIQTENGTVSEDAASIRALLDTCDLAAYIPPLRAIERGIVEKLEDEREKAAVRNIAQTLFE